MHFQDDNLDIQVTTLMSQVTWNDSKSGFVVLLSGDVGTVRDARGRGFYGITQKQLTKIYELLGVSRLEGYISLAHVRLMERSLPFCIVRQMHSGLYHGKPSMWVSVELK